MTQAIYVGTAGWSIPSRYRDAFPHEHSHLERYAARFNAVEINSSFYRPHRRTTYERWAASVPPTFRFSVKLPRSITHEHRLAGANALITSFAEEIGGLGEKLGTILVQLPPSLTFDPAVAGDFFDALHTAIPASIACEPRHASWFAPVADELLRNARVARVAADPARVAGAELPGGTTSRCYFRLHGSPVIYRSSYEEARLRTYADLIGRPAAYEASWCIFDNTASMAALGNALRLREILA
ncbi:hypothetical protein ASE00_03200 [Sphingomonas sp. Root710]|uniref:DUF72 domain-containing protein n=1 Tax=Sphingomonas sp. Root710 TaxID=1736594 RepID=UPI0006F5ED9A|nr:DUF72 domain-containing protein [Sphingomonas sp. Root710]KRB85790.1 hypothetical protein ASE00_03200 [Sphingomonas sp. Root710]